MWKYAIARKQIAENEILSSRDEKWVKKERKSYAYQLSAVSTLTQ